MTEARLEKFITIVKAGLNESIQVTVQDDTGEINDIERRAMRILKKVN